MSSPFFYAVYRGRKAGVFETWDECQQQVKGFSKPVYRKFKTFAEASAFSKTGDFKDNKLVKKRVREEEDDVKEEKRPRTIPKSSKIIVATTYKPERDGPAKVVYTDGASSNNGKANARAGYGIYWGDGDARNASVRLNGDRQTNQRAETMAIIHAVEQDIESEETLEIRTDSQYAINALTNWCVNWQVNDWQSKSPGKSVQNRDLFERALHAIQKRKGKVTFTHVAGHQGIKGNEEADRLAVLGATLPLK